MRCHEVNECEKRRFFVPANQLVQLRPGSAIRDPNPLVSIESPSEAEAFPELSGVRPADTAVAAAIEGLCQRAQGIGNPRISVNLMSRLVGRRERGGNRGTRPRALGIGVSEVGPAAGEGVDVG